MIEQVRIEASHEVLRYAVLQSGETWRIFGARRAMGHFQTRELAMLAGSRLAREAHDSGHQVEFLVQEDCGELVREDFARWAALPRSAMDLRSEPA